MTNKRFYDKNVFNEKTKKKNFCEDMQQLQIEKNKKHYSSEKHVCDTCNKEIDNGISRVLVMRDKDEGPRLLCFHFFFPCWDFELLIQKYPYFIIEKAGFSISEDIEMNDNSLKNLQKNLEFWNLPSKNII